MEILANYTITRRDACLWVTRREGKIGVLPLGENNNAGMLGGQGGYVPVSVLPPSPDEQPSPRSLPHVSLKSTSTHSEDAVMWIVEESSDQASNTDDYDEQESWDSFPEPNSDSTRDTSVMVADTHQRGLRRRRPNRSVPVALRPAAVSSARRSISYSPKIEAFSHETSRGVSVPLSLDNPLWTKQNGFIFTLVVCRASMNQKRMAMRWWKCSVWKDPGQRRNQEMFRMLGRMNNLLQVMFVFSAKRAAMVRWRFRLTAKFREYQKRMRRAEIERGASTIFVFAFKLVRRHLYTALRCWRAKIRPSAANLVIQTGVMNALEIFNRYCTKFRNHDLKHFFFKWSISTPPALPKSRYQFNTFTSFSEVGVSWDSPKLPKTRYQMDLISPSGVLQ